MITSRITTGRTLAGLAAAACAALLLGACSGDETANTGEPRADTVAAESEQGSETLDPGPEDTPSPPGSVDNPLPTDQDIELEHGLVVTIHETLADIPGDTIDSQLCNNTEVMPLAVVVTVTNPGPEPEEWFLNNLEAHTPIEGNPEYGSPATCSTFAPEQTNPLYGVNSNHVVLEPGDQVTYTNYYSESSLLGSPARGLLANSTTMDHEPTEPVFIDLGQ